MKCCTSEALDEAPRNKTQRGQERNQSNTISICVEHTVDRHLHQRSVVRCAEVRRNMCSRRNGASVGGDGENVWASITDRWRGGMAQQREGKKKQHNATSGSSCRTDCNPFGVEGAGDLLNHSICHATRKTIQQDCRLIGCWCNPPHMNILAVHRCTEQLLIECMSE